MSWPEGTSTSPVAQMLSSRPAHGAERHIVATVSHYIYHRHNPDLPSQATLLLKHLALVSCGYLARVYSSNNNKVLVKDFSHDYCFIMHLVFRYYDCIQQKPATYFMLLFFEVRSLPCNVMPNNQYETKAITEKT